MISQYPLEWPAGWERTQFPEYARFAESTIYRESRKVEGELNRLGAADVIISSNMPRNMDGSISSRPTRLVDTGVAVYFKVDNEDRCIPSDKYVTVEDNLHAVFLTIQALRGLERWGTGQIMQAAFRGFKALPESVIVTPYSAQPWYEVLEVQPNASREVISGAYRRLAAKYHPDYPQGDQAMFMKVNEAYKEGVRNAN